MARTFFTGPGPYPPASRVTDRRDPGHISCQAGLVKATTGVVTTRTAAVSVQHGDVAHGVGVRARTRAS